MSAETDAETGGIEGIVTDDQLVPIHGAIVGILGDTLGAPAQAGTDETGRFVLSRVKPGTANLAVQALGYESVQKRVEVTASAVTEVQVQLYPIEIIDPYHVTQIKRGRILCGTHVRPVVSFAACGAVYGTPLNGTDSFVVPFLLTTENLTAVSLMVFETQWVANQVLGSGLSVNWETFTDVTPAYTFTEPVRTFARANGKSPLWTSADHDTIKSNVTRHKPPPTHCPPVGPCKFWARVFPYANTLGPSSPVDVAFYVDQSYTHLATEFYGEAPTDRFSAVGDA